jgi:hypothetical protein
MRRRRSTACFIDDFDETAGTRAMHSDRSAALRPSGVEFAPADERASP